MTTQTTKYKYMTILEDHWIFKSKCNAFQHNYHPPLLNVKVLREIDEDIEYFPEKRSGIRTT